MAKKQKEVKKPQETISEILPTRYRLKCKNHIQKDFAKVITEKEIIIASGPAGVGKSYVSVARAIELLQNKTSPYKTIIISTPAEEVGENLGYLPGNLREKMDPFLASTLDIFDKIIGKKKRLELEESEIIQIQPLGFIRGKSIDNTILLMEEAQNMSTNQMKTLLTRIGENTKFIISGDLDQSDRYRDIKQSGLYDAIERHKDVEEIGFISFESKHIVRNPLITKILDNYKNDTKFNGVDASKVIRVEPRMVNEVGKKSSKDKESKIEPYYPEYVSPSERISNWFKKNFKW
jgi:phosphate starvation-inducible PhoH-like protein